MNTDLIRPHPHIGRTTASHDSTAAPAPRKRFIPSAITTLAAVVLIAISGCTAPATTQLPPVAIEPPSQTLRAGDVVKISFPRAPSLDTTQQIRRDGKINLYLVGEVHAADLAPSQLEKLLIDKYAAQLVSKEVQVTLVTSVFTVYVTGAVLRPGKINPEREITPLEAIMEAGGFDNTRANLRAVSIIRQQGGKSQNFVLDLQSVLEGKQGPRFVLHANDIIFVPERRSIF